LYLLSLLSAVHNIVIDRAIGAPGHGKDIVDGLNATDKRFLASKMRMIGLPEGSDAENRMAAESMVEGTSKSLAVECARLLSASTRNEGMKSHAKYAKRESNAALKKRHYHVQKQEDVLFSELKMQVKLKASKFTHSGLLAMYNIRADPDLGLSRVALRRIPCACSACIDQLQLLWIPNIAGELQGRYTSSENCELWEIFEGLNDWQIVSMEAKAGGNNENDVQEAEQIVMDGIADSMRTEIVPGNIGAFATEDPASDGYYIIQWTSAPFELESERRLNEFDPPIILKEGELVVKANYFYQVPRASKWYTPSSLETIVRLQQIAHPNLTLLKESDEHQLPNTCSKREARAHGAVRISDQEHDKILDHTSRTAIIDHEEDLLDIENYDLSSDEEVERDEMERDEESDDDSNNLNDE
jgi:hypothetical protein